MFMEEKREIERKRESKKFIIIAKQADATKETNLWSIVMNIGKYG